MIVALFLVGSVFVIALLIFACHVLKIASIFGVLLLVMPLAAVVNREG
jgi:hypothetical protein